MLSVWPFNILMGNVHNLETKIWFICGGFFFYSVFTFFLQDSNAVPTNAPISVHGEPLGMKTAEESKQPPVWFATGTRALAWRVDFIFWLTIVFFLGIVFDCLPCYAMAMVLVRWRDYQIAYLVQEKLCPIRKIHVLDWSPDVIYVSFPSLQPKKMPKAHRSTVSRVPEYN